jgi:hypothetical protein
MNAGAAFFITTLILIGILCGFGYLFSENADNLKDLEQAQQQVLQLQQQMAEQEAQRQSLAGALQQTQAALGQTTAERDQALQNVQQLAQRINILTSQAQGSQEQVQRLQAELASQQRRAADLETELKFTTEQGQGYVSAAITLAEEKTALEERLKGASVACAPLTAGLPAIDLGWIESLAPGLILTLANLLILGVFILNRLYARATGARPGAPIIRP